MLCASVCNVFVCASVRTNECMCCYTHTHTHTSSLEEAQCIRVPLSLDVPQLGHARGDQTLLDPPPIVHVEL